MHSSQSPKIMENNYINIERDITCRSALSFSPVVHEADTIVFGKPVENGKNFVLVNLKICSIVISKTNGWSWENERSPRWENERRPSPRNWSPGNWKNGRWPVLPSSHVSKLIRNNYQGHKNTPPPSNKTPHFLGGGGGLSSQKNKTGIFWGILVQKQDTFFVYENKTRPNHEL